MNGSKKPMKNVLMVGPVPPPYGGIAAVVQEIVNSELGRNYSFEIFDSQKGAPSSFGILRRLPFNVKRLLNFNSLISRKKFDFAHLHFDCGSFRGRALMILSLRLRGVKVLLHLHGTGWEVFYDEVSKTERLFARIGLKASDIIIVLYDLWVRKIREILPEAEVYVTSNFVQEVSSASPDTLRIYRDKFGFRDDDIVVVFVGGLGWRKGCFDILEAVPKVIAQNPRVKFLLVGGDDYPGEFEKIRGQVVTDGLSEWIHLTGEASREDVTIYMQMSQIFLLPTYREGAPVAIIEAMRASLPIITTPVGGIPDMVQDGLNGLLIQPGNPEIIAQTALSLASDPDLRAKLGKAAREVFTKRYSSSRAIGELAEIYKKIEQL
jgi:glycosyltransferase involved in cell wall biosynthesis